MLLRQGVVLAVVRCGLRGWGCGGRVFLAIRAAPGPRGAGWWWDYVDDVCSAAAGHEGMGMDGYSELDTLRYPRFRPGGRMCTSTSIQATRRGPHRATR